MEGFYSTREPGGTGKTEIMHRQSGDWNAQNGDCTFTGNKKPEMAAAGSVSGLDDYRVTGELYDQLDLSSCDE